MAKSKKEKLEQLKKFNGFQEDFLDKKVKLPTLPSRFKGKIAEVDASFGKDNILKYQNYSVLQHKERRLPIYSAANIHGDALTEAITRAKVGNYWRLDPRIKRDHQWALKLYQADKSDFDKGHMTKREDVQWGKDLEEAKVGAKSTFYYTNAVPQAAKLNQRWWRSLESYIIDKIWKEKVEKKGLEGDERLVKRISMFTGPVLLEEDPVFVTKVDEQEVQIPTIFWKVIYYTSKFGKLYRVAFVMGQEDVLKDNGIVKDVSSKGGLGEDDFEEETETFFSQFKKMPASQVPVAMIEELTGLTFSPGEEPENMKKKSIDFKAIEKEVQAKGGLGDDDYDDYGDEEEEEAEDTLELTGIELEF